MRSKKSEMRSEKCKVQNWIVASDGTAGKESYSFECLRCGEVQKVATPIDLEIWLAMSVAFTRIHRGCRP